MISDYRRDRPASMSNSLIIHMRQRVAECRRLASAIADEPIATILRQMAEEGEADIRSAGREHAEVQSGATSFDLLRGLLPDAPTACLTEDHVLSLISARRGREALFGSHLFSDPAWDVILQLYAERLGERQISVSGLARVIGAPTPVIARWIAILVDAGIASNAGSSKEMETAMVELTPSGVSKMAQLADQWCSAFTSI